MEVHPSRDEARTPKTDEDVIDQEFRSSNDPTGLWLNPVITGWPANDTLDDSGLTIPGKWDYSLLDVQPPKITEIADDQAQAPTEH